MRNDTRQDNRNDLANELGLVLSRLFEVVADRRDKRPEGSYTAYLFDSGLDKMLKKIAEESGEVIIAAKNGSTEELTRELSDLLYHLVVLMVEAGVTADGVSAELERRAAPSSET